MQTFINLSTGVLLAVIAALALMWSGGFGRAQTPDFQAQAQVTNGDVPSLPAPGGGVDVRGLFESLDLGDYLVPHEARVAWELDIPSGEGDHHFVPEGKRLYVTAVDIPEAADVYVLVDGDRFFPKLTDVDWSRGGPVVFEAGVKLTFEANGVADVRGLLRGYAR